MSRPAAEPARPDAAIEQALQAWPQWRADLQEKPQILQSLGSGLSHTCLLVQAGEQRFALRREQADSRTLAIMSLAQEARLMQQLQAPPALTPELVWYSEHCLVTRFVEQRNWRWNRQLTELCETLHRLHSQPSALPGFDMLQHCAGYWQRIQQDSRVPADITELYRRCTHTAVQLLRENPAQCLCHNDLNPDNILYSPQGFVLLDWEYASLNSPYFDLASLAEYFALDDAQLKQLSQTYWQSDDSPVRLQALKDFRLLVRFSEWLWLLLKWPERAGNCHQRLQLLLPQ